MKLARVVFTILFGAFALVACGTAPQNTLQPTVMPSPAALPSPQRGLTVAAATPTTQPAATTAPTATAPIIGQTVAVSGGAFTRVSPEELKAMLARKNFVFVNTHIPYEGEIAQTDSFMPFDTIAQNLQQLPADQNAQIFLYCRSGRMSTEAAETLVKLGYTNVWELGGGMIEWARKGFTLIQK